jgi:hypothetical protein
MRSNADDKSKFIFPFGNALLPFPLLLAGMELESGGF